MRLLNPDCSLDDFFERVHNEKSLLLLDYDGTLSPFQIDPQKAVPYEGIMERIARIMCFSRVIIISGRALDSLLPLLDFPELPEIWGSHGGERLDVHGRRTRMQFSESQVEALNQGKAIGHKYALPGRCEEKPFSVAVHWRGLPDRERLEIASKVCEEWDALAREHDIEVHDFDGGIELRPKGMNKGGAVRSILQSAKESVIAYLGDDATDEEAFSVLADKGLKVLVRQHIRPTQADIQLIPPKELLAFFDRWLDSVER